MDNLLMKRFKIDDQVYRPFLPVGGPIGGLLRGYVFLDPLQDRGALWVTRTQFSPLLNNNSIRWVEGIKKGDEPGEWSEPQ